MFLGIDLRHSETWATIGLIIGGGMLFTTLVLEFVFALSACSLCLSQRYCMFIGVLITGCSLLFDPRRGIFPLLTILCCLGGIYFVGYQLYLQYVPGATESCGAALDFLLENDYPWSDVFVVFFQGSESCANKSAIPFLSFFGFVVLISIAVLQLRLGPRSTYK